MNRAKELVQLLRHGGLRCRLGAILLPKVTLGKEATLATQLDIHYLDFAADLLTTIPQDAAFLSLTIDRMLDRLDTLANTPTDRDCILLANYDLPLSRMPYEHRLLLWDHLLLDFPYKKNALILALPGVLPHTALLPEGLTRTEWLTANRLVTLSQGNPLTL